MTRNTFFKHCNSCPATTELIKQGKRNGIQRYRCRKCHREALARNYHKPIQHEKALLRAKIYKLKKLHNKEKNEII